MPGSDRWCCDESKLKYIYNESRSMVQGVVSYYERDKITKINKSPDHKCSYSLCKVENIINRAS